MASKTLVVSFMLSFCIPVVGAIPIAKYGVQSENQDDINCTEAKYQFFSGNFCRPYSDVLQGNALMNHYPDATEDFYHNVSQWLTAFCASQCKRILVAFFKCENETGVISNINNGICGKVNQKYCYVHHLRETAAGTIVTYAMLVNICPYNSNNNLNYCVEGVCQLYVTQWADYMGCCASPLFRPDFNLTTCGITNTTPCSSRPSKPSETPSLFEIKSLKNIKFF